MIIAYMEEEGIPQKERTIMFSDLIRNHKPEFVSLSRGDLLLTFESDPARSWTLKALYTVKKFEETGDAFIFNVDLQVAFASARAPQADEIVLERNEMLAELNWLPHPTSFFKPFPSHAWRWLGEKKGVTLPNTH